MYVYTYNSDIFCGTDFLISQDLKDLYIYIYIVNQSIIYVYDICI